MMATYVRPAPVMASGKGSYLFDMDDNKYIDLTAGIAVTALGHSDPQVTEVVQQQVGYDIYKY